MSIFNELLPKINEISNAYAKNFNDDLKAIFECFDKFEEEYQNGRAKGREKGQKDKNLMTTLQSINEDDDESNKTPDDKTKQTTNGKSKGTESRSSSDSNSEPRRLSSKRSKNEVDGLCSPEQDKRVKRNASVKAQSIISKQVNVNLNQKMRREEPDKSRGRRRKEDDKENEPDLTNIQIKQEKVSLPPEPMDTDSLPINIEVKQEVDKDEIAMPPPAAPVPKPRKAAAKEKSDLSKEKSDSEEETSTRSRRNTRTRKQTDTMPPPAPVAAPRSTRASSRASSRAKPAEIEEPVPPAEPRPKRTRAKKKASETPTPEPEKDTTQTEVSGTASPAEKPRPKRTRRGQKAAEKQEPPKPEDPKPEEPKTKAIHQPTPPKEEPQSPILPQKQPKEAKKKEVKSKIPVKDATPENKVTVPETEVISSLNETQVLHKMDTTVNLEMDKTIVLPNGVYNHAPVTPTPKPRNMNDTVVIETCNRETIVLEKQNTIMDATVTLDKDPKAINISEDNSIMTDDNSDVQEHTPPKPVPTAQPTSAVKEKVQQFEEMASRVTRTKTRAMAKKDDVPENHTPPDKVSKVILSAETLSKMNNLIFNGKSQISTSASKPRANVPVPVKNVPASASKVSAISKAREAEESLKREKEDARKKKEALLEAKREQQRRKREEKMAAAAAAREAADRERLAQLEAAARERLEKQAHADQGKLERIKEVERKKLENARKAAEIEERRRAEDLKQKQKLEEEQRREAARRKQIEEAEATKKEAALMAKEIEKRQKEYIEKHRIKQKMEDRMHNTPLKYGTPGAHYPPLEPVYMADGFQYLNSDEEEEEVQRPTPAWSTSKARKQQLFIQCQLAQLHVDKLFSVRVHSPDLREIFPNIERSRLKRTSSAVWRTPPQRLSKVAE